MQTRGADLSAFGVGAGGIVNGSAPAQTPQARFPAVIAVVRVQDANYYCPGIRTSGGGAYSVVTSRDAEIDQDLSELARQPMIRGIVPLNHLVLPQHFTSDSELRTAARSLDADMLLIYTLESSSDVDHHLPALGAVTLGLLPEGEAMAHCTASAILVDARTGYIYALGETTEKKSNLTSSWGTGSASNRAIRSAERKAMNKLVLNLKDRWSEVVRQYATTAQARDSSAQFAAGAYAP